MNNLERIKGKGAIMEYKISPSKNSSVQYNQRVPDVKSQSNEEFIQVLNAYILAADHSNSLAQVSVDVPTQNELTLRCLLGSINLPKAVETDQYIKASQAYTIPSQGLTGVGSTAQIIARNISSLYEGGGVAGNFDGQGMSLGYLQWNIGSGTLQPLLKEMAFGDNTKGDFDKIFAQQIKVKNNNGNIVTKSLSEQIRGMLQMNSVDQLNWAKSINKNNKIEEPWKSAFNLLLQNEKFKTIEDKYAKSYFNKAENIVNDSAIGVKTVRGYTLAFDIAVQNGSLKSSAKNLVVDALAGKNNKLTNPNDSSLTKNQRDIIVDLNKRLSTVTDNDTKKLYYTAAAVAISSRDQYAKDVWARKSTIVSGSGIVHGKNYAFNNSGLSDNLLV